MLRPQSTNDVSQAISALLRERLSQQQQRQPQNHEQRQLQQQQQRVEVEVEVQQQQQEQQQLVQPGRVHLLRSSHSLHFSHNNLSSCASALTQDEEGQVSTLTLDLSLLDQVLDIDAEQGTVTVQAGMTIEVSDGRVRVEGRG